MQEIARIRSFGGWQLRFRHRSSVLSCDMHFSLYLPPQAQQPDRQGSVPLLTWLSGLTCTDENFVQKAGAQRAAAQHGVALLAPDTSPRGENVPDDPNGGWDFGVGAGFYVNATQAPWDKHYRMYDYVVEELPALVLGAHDALDADAQAIFGHSMGGHGALTIALRSARYRSVSAFAPICSPMNCPWGEKALSAYLGNDRDSWRAHDSCELLRSTDVTLPILVDQGSADGFLEEQLKTHLLQEALQDARREPEALATVRMQEGYDHSYFFIASFIEEHVAFHASHCRGQGS